MSATSSTIPKEQPFLPVATPGLPAGQKPRSVNVPVIECYRLSIEFSLNYAVSGRPVVTSNLRSKLRRNVDEELIVS